MRNLAVTKLKADKPGAGGGTAEINGFCVVSPVTD